MRSGAIGDVVQTTNLYRSIRQNNPDALIDYATSSAPRELLSHDPDIHNVYSLEKKDYWSLIKLAYKLRKNKYDLIINLQPSIRYRFLGRLIMAKKIVKYKHLNEYHAVENYMHYGKKIIPELVTPKDLKIYMSPELIRQMSEKFKTDKKIVIFNTQATASRYGRKWNIKHFLDLSKLLIDKYDCEIIVSGAKEDREKVECFVGLHKNIKVIAGEYDLMEIAAIFSLADLFISGDTGPLHIASAVGKPVCVGLYGSMPISRSSPWGMKHHAICTNLPCVPCCQRRCRFTDSEFTPCLEEIKPEHVMQLIETYSLL